MSPRLWSAHVVTAGRSRHRDLSAAIYGTIVSDAVLASVDQAKPIWTVALAVVVTVLVYWLAERYSEFLAAHVRGERLSARQFPAAVRRGWPMVQASYSPVLVLAGAALLGAETPVAITAAVLYTTGLLVALGFLAGRRTGQSGLALAATVAFAGGLGVIIVLLKLALH